MPIKILASDGKQFIRGSGNKVFKACIGVAISFENPEEFKDRYTEFFEELKQRYNIHDPRYIFKSYDLKKKFGEKYIVVEEEFASLFDNQTYVNFVFSSFNTQQMPEVKYYQGDMRATESKNTMEFLNKLQNYYSYIAAWKIVREASLRGLEIYVDNFGKQEITKAWMELKKYNNVKVFPKGDQCNVFISSADILLDLIDSKMRVHKTRLDLIEIKNLNKDKIGIENFKVFYCGNKDIDYIVPYSKDEIPKNDDLACPLIYVVGEEVIRKESYWIENSKIYPLLLRFAADKNSGIKFISHDEDFRKVREGDYLLYLGDKGKEKASFLAETLHYPFEVVGLDKILEKYNVKDLW